MDNLITKIGSGLAVVALLMGVACTKVQDDTKLRLIKSEEANVILNEKNDVLTVNLQAANDDIDTLEADVASKKTQIAGLKNDVSIAKGERDAKIAELKQEIAAHKVTMNEKTQLVADLESEKIRNTTLIAEKAELTDNFESLEKELAAQVGLTDQERAAKERALSLASIDVIKFSTMVKQIAALEKVIEDAKESGDQNLALTIQVELDSINASIDLGKANASNDFSKTYALTTNAFETAATMLMSTNAPATNVAPANANGQTTP